MVDSFPSDVTKVNFETDVPATDSYVDTVEVLIEKDNETAQFFPSTLDFRTQSIDRRLKATLEEAIAKRRTEQENTKE